MRSLRLVLALIGSLAAVGCTQPSSVQCADGLVCPPGTTCAAHQSVCIKTLCGNGSIDTAAGEACDDGNIVDGDGCSADCKSNESCGNHVVDTAAGEVCDDGNTASGDGCSADCKSDESCGNGITDTAKGEVCDDGNNVSGDGCAADCKSTERCGNGVTDVVDGEVCDKGADNNKCMGCSTDCKSNETCGNGIVDACKGEVCDDGNNISGDGCSSDCKSNETCGNHVVDTIKGEVCDDGNTVSGDGCSADCKSEEHCGNGTVDKGEECDPGTDLSAPCGAGMDCPAETATCNRDCTVAFCGDHKTNRTRGEECDDGVETAHCNANCTLAACGDGVLNVVAGEQCDAGNGMSPGACTATCTNALDCMTKACTSTSCTTSCSATADIANCNGNGAGLASCHTSACGDGHINSLAGETCDNPGGADIGGCNGKNAGAVACHMSECGDGYVNTADGEECDTLGGGDTQTCNGKGAGTAKCKIPKCGDGYVNALANETCDPPGANGADTLGCNGKTAGAVACQVPTCGDGYANPMASETCDTLGGADTATCNGNSAAAKAANVACLHPQCGDTYKNSAAGEACDNGPADSGSCNGNSAAAIAAGVACKTALCGDSYTNTVANSPVGGEQCDNGSSNSNSAACLASCKNASCGDGFVQTGVEICDTGSTSTTAGCSTCTAFDPGWTCAGAGAGSCHPVCGDGDTVALTSPTSLEEVCDDHNVNSCGLCNNAGGCTLASGAKVTAAVPATGQIVGAGTYRDGKIFKLSDGAHTLTFEFDKDGSVGAGNIGIDVTGATASQVVCRICEAITGSGLNISASGNCPGNCSSGTTITLQNKTAGAVGNVDITTTVTDPTFVGGLKGMHNGAAEDCGAGIGCTNDADCASDVCFLNQTCPPGVPCGSCAAPACNDNKKNGLETDKDCGGGACPACADLLGCIASSDCASGVCKSTLTDLTNPGTCAQPKCNDTVQNGAETDVDCGGGTCPQCPVTEGCKFNSDCSPPATGNGVAVTTSSGVCDTVTSLTCVPAELLQVVVVGNGSVASTSAALKTGDISCTKAGGSGCLQAYESGGSVTVTATSNAASGNITWSDAGCTACPVSATPPTTCSCTETMSNNLKLTVTTP